MKAIFIDNGVIERIEINEAYSSGCGSFISTFAHSLDYSVEDFVQAACLAPSPCDLGTRCTVFMNSKVKQVLREGVSVPDIAAGLSYSVVRNCLYKVLRLKDTTPLGDHIVVQGGTMRNDSIVRCLELLTGKNVYRSDNPELMGASGCAFYALKNSRSTGIPLEAMIGKAAYEAAHHTCSGCVNRCTVTRYRFDNGNVYYSGNRCEKVFSNKGTCDKRGQDAYESKRELLFGCSSSLPSPHLTLGIPRCLNMYEEYPFWHTLFTACNIQVRLSAVPTLASYERNACKVMSDNICFPAKITHSNVDELLRRSDVDRVFIPFVVFERQEKHMQNSYNCPIVSGYSQVVGSVQAGNKPIDTPVMTFKNSRSLYKQCKAYLETLGVATPHFKKAFLAAQAEQARFEAALATCNHKLLEMARREGRTVVLLAGRPYHSDPLIQHKVSDMIVASGAYVLTDDVVRNRDNALYGIHYLSQWAFTNRIMKAATWAAGQPGHVQFMQLTSFGCGPDAFLTDEVQALLKRSGKSYTLLKIDDVNNIGSLRLRVRSLIESLRLKGSDSRPSLLPPSTTPAYTPADTKKKIIAPFFTPFVSPLIPSLMKLAGYDVDCLPISDAESCDWGLKFSNNEVCYPATLIVEDIVKAFRNDTYDPENTCVAITQAGGQCRASNYMALIRKALVEKGHLHTPVVALSFGSGISNEQPGFHIHWPKMLPVTLAALLFEDCIAKFYYAAIVRESRRGAADALRDTYLNRAQGPILRNQPEALYKLLEEAADAFNAICREETCPKVGLVGEIFLKFHPFAQKHVTDWLVTQHIEVIYPMLTDFFMQSFVNAKENKRNHLSPSHIPDFVIDFMYRKVRKRVERVNAIGQRFRHFTPFDNIFEKADIARSIISLGAQFGEGWLIAGEMASLTSQGITHVINLQPFGCIANHIAEKGIENKLKQLYPAMNILSLDFDSSVSEVNIANRLHLFIHDLKKEL